MIFDELGLPKDNGATDFQDSARLAGLLTVFEWPQKIDLTKYISNDKYVRHPKEYIYDFSRDQAICYLSGLSKVNGLLVDRKMINGKDIFSPSQKGHIKICQGKKPNFFERKFLWLDVFYSCFYQPMGEPNQLLCMLMINPDQRCLKFWLKYNKHWRDAIREYWCDGAGEWRGERELAEHMITVLEGKNEK